MEEITLALAKGRTAKNTLKLLDKANIFFDDLHDDSRKLVFYSKDKKIKLIFVKAVDVPTYVERGAADVGIVGKDNILEDEPDIYELLDLELGKCEFVVAGYPDQDVNTVSSLIVASKYPNVARKHFEQKGIAVEIVKLNGSVELAPLIGLTDVIVDIKETGTTIVENGLAVLEEMDQISARAIVNKASFATKTKGIQDFIAKLESVLE